MIFFYKIIGFVLIPIIKINIGIRIKNQKESASRYKERFGLSTEKVNTQKKIIWIHAASIGEFKSTNYLINNYYKEYTLLVTTTTLSAANYAKKTYGNKIIHQFAPLDVSIWVKRFLKNWKPSLVIWIESDLWPVTLNMIQSLNINAILVNVRLSPTSFKRWKLIPSFYNNLMHCFSDIFAQSKNDQKRIQSLSNKNIKFIGNLKLTPSKDTDNFEEKKTKLTQIMLASTHEKEEEQLLPVLTNLLNDYKNLRLIIAPRHPERSKDIIDLCSRYNFSSELESEKKINSSQILILDSFGILSDYFAISDIVFLGGSLVPAGGHNPIEPAQHKCAIITGPHLFNWQNIFDEMIHGESCIMISSIENLKFEIQELLKDKNKIEKLKTNAYIFSKKEFVDINLLDRTISNHMKSI